MSRNLTLFKPVALNIDLKSRNKTLFEYGYSHCHSSQIAVEILAKVCSAFD